MDLSTNTPLVDLVSLGGNLSLILKSDPAGRAPLSGRKPIS